ncbi:MAG: glycosyltransferase [Chthoniobacteraceae bacterium]|jgi:GT2 family glycosyltransferase
MKLSVIIPTCNRPDRLQECLGRVLKQSGSYEVIVSDDGWTGAFRLAGVKWVQGPRRGPAANRNCGARHASGDWLVFLDDDCLPEDGWLEAYEAAMTGDAEILEGQTVCPMEDRLGFYEVIENLDGGAFWSCNLALRREEFEKLGGFDEDFTEACAEDMEFAWRMRQRGSRSAFVEKATVTHPPRALGAAGLLRRTAAHRWILLYRLKTGQASKRPLPRAVGKLVAREYADSLRMLYHLQRAGERRRIKGNALWALWRWVSLPWFMPYYIWWDLRWRFSGKDGLE